jgi:glycerol-3-phosphate acyltransferase PlsY
MNPLLLSALCGVLGYLLGSIPFGWIIVKLLTGTDVRTFGSGRTGGTNVFRAAGRFAGFATAILDVAKGLVTVLVLKNLGLNTGGLAESLAGLGVILGHNHSIFLKFKGGAGGATAVGTGFGFSLLAGVLALVLGAFMLLVVGYASLATLTAAFVVAIAMTVLAITGAVPVPYVIFGWGSVVLCALALRPNIQRLLQGNERRVDILKLRSPNSNP